MMCHRATAIRYLLAPFYLLLVISTTLAAGAWARDPGHLEQLAYREALFHSHQQDYLAAINRLQLAEAQGLLSPTSDDARLLLARMKLAYGLHIEAGFDLHALLGEGVPAQVRNRAWYELARVFFHKGYKQAAAEVLASVQGEVPADISGDYQLLHATVLMSLDRNLEAANELVYWRGAPELAAYAHYNRGIALLRAGEPQQAISILKMAVKMPARDEELLALRDKARLSLGYSLAREGQYRLASRQLEEVRPGGPFSNRALLALGWIAHKQGRTDSALVSWTELRGRSPTDPAVLETLFLVPAVHRELDALQTASQDYEMAMSAYARELERLREVRESVQAGGAVSRLLQKDSESGQEGEAGTDREPARYFGPLLASRDFREMRQGHEELYAMLESVDRGLHEIDVLAQAIPPANAPPVPELPLAPPAIAGKTANKGRPSPVPGTRISRRQTRRTTAAIAVDGAERGAGSSRRSRYPTAAGHRVA